MTSSWAGFEKRALDVSTPTTKPPAATPPPQTPDGASPSVDIPVAMNGSF